MRGERERGRTEDADLNEVKGLEDGRDKARREREELRNLGLEHSVRSVPNGNQSSPRSATLL